VTYNGAPLPGASVSFAPATEGQGNPAYGRTDAEGRYTLQTLLGNPDAGTTPGEYRVAIRKTEEIPATEDGKELRQSIDPKSLIPVRYGSYGKSELTATVEKGKPNVFDFALQK